MGFLSIWPKETTMMASGRASRIAIDGRGGVYVLDGENGKAQLLSLHAHGGGLQMPAAAAGPVGLGDDKGDIAGSGRRFERRHGHPGRAHEDDARAGTGQLCPPASPHFSPYASSNDLSASRARTRDSGSHPVDEERAVDVVDLVLKDTREEVRGGDFDVIAFQVVGDAP